MRGANPFDPIILCIEQGNKEDHHDQEDTLHGQEDMDPVLFLQKVFVKIDVGKERDDRTCGPDQIQYQTFSGFVVGIQIDPACEQDRRKGNGHQDKETMEHEVYREQVLVKVRRIGDQENEQIK